MLATRTLTLVRKFIAELHSVKRRNNNCSHNQLLYRTNVSITNNFHSNKSVTERLAIKSTRHVVCFHDEASNTSTGAMKTSTNNSKFRSYK